MWKRALRPGVGSIASMSQMAHRQESMEETKMEVSLP